MQIYQFHYGCQRFVHVFPILKMKYEQNNNVKCKRANFFLNSAWWSCWGFISGNVNSLKKSPLAEWDANLTGFAFKASSQQCASVVAPCSSHPKVVLLKLGDACILLAFGPRYQNLLCTYCSLISFLLCLFVASSIIGLERFVEENSFQFLFILNKLYQCFFHWIKTNYSSMEQFPYRAKLIVHDELNTSFFQHTSHRSNCKCPWAICSLWQIVPKSSLPF